MRCLQAYDGLAPAADQVPEREFAKLCYHETLGQVFLMSTAPNNEGLDLMFRFFGHVEHDVVVAEIFGKQHLVNKHTGENLDLFEQARTERISGVLSKVASHCARNTGMALGALDKTMPIARFFKHDVVGQVVLVADSNEDGAPTVEWYYETGGERVRQVVPFEKSETGFDFRNHLIASIDATEAEAIMGEWL